MNSSIESSVSVTKRANSTIVLSVLALCVFSIGMTEFVIMGILPQIANDLHVSISKTGLLVTAYSIGVAIGAPVLTVVTYRMPRKAVLISLMSIFVLGHLISVLSTNFTVLIISRLVASFSHGSFFGIASIVAINLVPAHKKASAISVLLTGASIANILGVPFGTFLGQLFGWQACFAIIALVSFIGLIAIIFFVPFILNNSEGDIKKEFLVLNKPQVILALLITIFSFGGVFTTFTYIAPILEQLSHFSASSIIWILIIFGIGVTIGNVVGGKLADWKLYPAMLITTISLTLVFLLVAFIWVKAIMIGLVFLLGVTSFSILPSLQVNILRHAEEAPQVASSINVSIIHIGNACGAILGGWVLDSQWGLASIPVASSFVTIVGIILILISAYVSRKDAALR
ncbi:MFS transporter [Shimazuella alba]|uniref:MFS transporter n=1 Tax=Shimazuella alba TaxID=2690964 RepID=A0A6I4VXU9_9BACL|nr:MFS transporter [Shimazuella alba]MXQ54720.1 MFS transporter [Shimazuella alba]